MSIRCDGCGRFCIPASETFVPSNHFGPEEQLWCCASCTEEHGPPVPLHQRGAIDLSKVQRRVPS